MIRAACTLIVVTLIVTLGTLPVVRAYALSAFILPDLLSLPWSPAVLVTGGGSVESLRFSRADADLILPRGNQRTGGLVITLGVRPLDKRDPVVSRFVTALARANVATLIVQSDRLLSGAIDPDEPVNLVEAFTFLRAHPRVDPDRVGIFGFSAGGSIAALAAADPRIAQDVRVLVLIGAFADARTLAAEIQSGASLQGDGSWRPWQPHPLAREVFLLGLVEDVQDPYDRAELRRWIEDPSYRPTPTSHRARLTRDLLDSRDAAETLRLVHALSADAGDRLGSISPVEVGGRIHAATILLVDRSDPLVPVSHTERLREALDNQSIARHTAFDLFEHVQPNRAVPIGILARDLGLLVDAMAAMLLIVDPAGF